jgi:hypothetical protein
MAMKLPSRHQIGDTVMVNRGNRKICGKVVGVNFMEFTVRYIVATSSSSIITCYSQDVNEMLKIVPCLTTKT